MTTRENPAFSRVHSSLSPNHFLMQEFHTPLRTLIRMTFVISSLGFIETNIKNHNSQGGYRIGCRGKLDVKPSYRERCRAGVAVRGMTLEIGFLSPGTLKPKSSAPNRAVRETRLMIDVR